MTVPLTSGAFDMDVAHPLRAARISHGDARGRAVAIGVTVALHVAVAAGLIAGVHVVSIVVPPALMVQINLPKSKVEKALAPAPVLQKPMMVTAPPPEIAVQPAPSPITVQLAAPAPAPPPAAVAPQSVAGEGHDAFLGRLLGQLNRFKQYPRAARQAHIEGVVMLHFVMDANGTVLSAEIAKSSGRPVLDAEALALIRRAQPLPALPADFPTRTLDAVVPIEFSLGG